MATTLLTEDDIKEKVLSPELENAAVDKIMGVLSTDIHTLALNVCESEEKYDSMKEKLTDGLTEQIMVSVENIGVGDIIATEGKRIVKEKVGGSMLAMFVSDDLLNSIIQPIGGEVDKYIAENGEGYVRPEIISMIGSVEESSIKDLCGKVELDEDALHNVIVSVYRGAVDTAVGKIMESFNVAGIIEDKINNMSVEELEKLVFAVMKKELDMIVNLGALVGGILGIFNMFF